MRILVTGGTGFVGRYLISHLRSKRHTIFATYLNPADSESEILPRDRLLHCDVSDRDSFGGLMREVRPSQIYHLAGRSSVIESFHDARQVYDTNFGGALNLLEAAREFVPKARILLVGSAQSYGTVAVRFLPIIESHPFRPESPYAFGKAAADLLGYQFSCNYGLQVVRARPFNHTGPGQPSEFVCSNFARQIAEIELGLQKPIVSVGTLNVKRDFSDVRDVVRAYELLLEHGQPGEAYNVASGRPISLKDILKVLMSFSEKTIRIRIEKERLRAHETRSLYGNVRKLCAATHWRPNFTIESTLFDLFQYWKASMQKDSRAHSALSAGRKGL